jgi:hypothetical protein
MKTVTMAVLLLLAVASIVFGETAESGKSRYGHKTCLAVLLQTLNYDAVYLINLKLRHDDLWGQMQEKPQAFLKSNLGAEVKTRPSGQKKVTGDWMYEYLFSIAGNDKVFIIHSFSSVSYDISLVCS